MAREHNQHNFPPIIDTAWPRLTEHLLQGYASHSTAP